MSLLLPQTQPPLFHNLRAAAAAEPAKGSFLVPRAPHGRNKLEPLQTKGKGSLRTGGDSPARRAGDNSPAVRSSESPSPVPPSP